MRKFFKILMFITWILICGYFGLQHWSERQGWYEGVALASDDVESLLAKRLNAIENDADLKCIGDLRPDSARNGCLTGARDWRERRDYAEIVCGGYAFPSHCYVVIIEKDAFNFMSYRQTILNYLSDPCEESGFVKVNQGHEVPVCPSRNHSLTIDESHPDKVYIRLLINE